MDNQLQVFKNIEFGQVRIVIKNREPWFVGKDVAEVLGYSNTRDAISRHVEAEDKAEVGIHDGSQNRNMIMINESGLYSLVLLSTLPSAKKFKRWVTAEVLPSIRKHGMYATDELLDNPDLLIAAATRLKEERAARLEAEKQVQILAPKAEFFDQVAESKDAIAIGDAAKVLNMGIGQNKLFKFLRDSKILKSDNIPYQEYIDRGYFRTIEQKFTTTKSETRIYIKTLVFQKGLEFIRRALKETISESA